MLSNVDGSAAPSGCGWSLLAVDSEGDHVYAWPNVPAGLRSFDVNAGSSNDIILAEFSGAPASVRLDTEVNTGDPDASVAMLSTVGGAPAFAGELLVVYLNTAAASSTSIVAWSEIGTDTEQDYGWWSTGGTGAPSITATLSPATAAELMLVAIK
jgi:hypothetical protein